MVCYVISMKMNKILNLNLNGEEVDVEVCITLSYDSDYGADADGNRGIAVYSINDYDFTILNNVKLDKDEYSELVDMIEDSFRLIEFI